MLGFICDPRNPPNITNIGVFFIFLGIMTFFDSALMAFGNVSIVVGLF